MNIFCFFYPYLTCALREEEKSKLQQEDSFKIKFWDANVLSVSSSGTKISDSNFPAMKKSCHCVSTRCRLHSDSTGFTVCSYSNGRILEETYYGVPVAKESCHCVSTRCRLHSDSTRFPLHSDSTRCSLHPDSDGHEQKTYFGDQPYRCWILGTLVGTGAFGKVYTCFPVDRGTNIIWAVKMVKIEMRFTDSVAALKNEISILKKLRHERIVSFYGSEERDGNLHLFMEFLAGGSLSDHIRKNGVLSEGESRKYTRQILEGVSFLHSKDIIHRDIKGSNVLLDGKGNVRLTDFGLAKTLQKIGSTAVTRNTGSQCGTFYWMAPEIIMSRAYGRKADIWSLGCTVVEMLTGKPPLGHLPLVAAMFTIANGPIVPTLPEGVSQAAKEFIQAALTWEPDERPWSDELLSYEFAA